MSCLIVCTKRMPKYPWHLITISRILFTFRTSVKCHCYYVHAYAQMLQHGYRLQANVFGALLPMHKHVPQIFHSKQSEHSNANVTYSTIKFTVLLHTCFTLQGLKRQETVKKLFLALYRQANLIFVSNDDFRPCSLHGSMLLATEWRVVSHLPFAYIRTTRTLHSCRHFGHIHLAYHRQTGFKRFSVDMHSTRVFFFCVNVGQIHRSRLLPTKSF